MTDQTTTTTTSPPPLRIGVLLFPGFQALDVFGPLDVLNVLSWSTNSPSPTTPSPTPPISLTLLSTTLSPISTLPPSLPNALSQSILPTATLASSPQLDVLLIPGGWGTRAPLPEHIEYIRSVYPSLKYLLTVCTGGKLAARAGVLDGKRATTNKNDWESVVRDAPRVEWVREARWVVDKPAENGEGVEVWSSAGVSAGVDLMFAWVESIWGEEVAGRVERVLEFRRWREGGVDPFVRD
ncbi:DJ-1/PfpI family protein [Aspergillus vadensis CBS 113365]|uniref:Class I glutamine amidotransferase-like protein n=1 Tax=Aspergillus vadensis (strain CBS 113365 / IMI 142717 / IBT 24658) TaxID=1448311 RepID=A0A319BKX9_ASPVC|nr:class I glutamine amidotransferase-like protein [Aspergillus vadensis CBS 113365]PYH66353.1 class I glutamine amidotransferase-like protein [Aspergillus vadensis CBS 113365]